MYERKRHVGNLSSFQFFYDPKSSLKKVFKRIDTKHQMLREMNSIKKILSHSLIS